MGTAHPTDFTFRAWSDKQAQRFLSVLPQDLVGKVVTRKWSESSRDVIVTITYAGTLQELQGFLNKAENVTILRKTLARSSEFTFRGR